MKEALKILTRSTGEVNNIREFIYFQQQQE